MQQRLTIPAEKKTSFPFLIRIAVKFVQKFAKLSPKTQLNLGKRLGRLFQKLLKSHQKSVAVNLTLCFPNKNEISQKHLTQTYFESFGMGLVECALAGFTGDKELPPCYVDGLEFVKPFIEEKRPIIFISGHFMTLMMMGRIMSQLFPFCAVFRLQRNDLFNNLFTHYATQYGVSLISPKLATIMETLEVKKNVLYFVDQDHGLRHSIFAPFFNVQAATIKALPVLAKTTGAAVIPVFCYRQTDPVQYTLAFLPPFENYPNPDAYQNALHINQILEQAIEKQPELYFWYYKRFRTRPSGEKSPYC